MSQPSMGSAFYAPLRNMRATNRFLLLTAAACSAGFFVFCAIMYATGVLTHLGPIALPAHAYLDFLGLAFIAFAVPYGVLEHKETERVTRIEERIPDFLGDLASLHKAGLTLMDATHVAAQGNYGPLTPEIRQASVQVKWGVPVLEALALLRDRLATPLVNRTLTVVIEAGHAGGNVKQVLTIAAEISRRLSQMRRQRKAEMLLFLLIIYVASAVFLMVVLALQGVFVPKMVQAIEGIGSKGGGVFGMKKVPTVDDFRGLFVTAALVQSIGNGFVGGMMSEGRYESGVKHAAIMVALALVAFWAFG